MEKNTLLAQIKIDVPARVVIGAFMAPVSPVQADLPSGCVEKGIYNPVARDEWRERFMVSG